MTGGPEETTEARNSDRREQARWLILLASMAGALYLCWLMLEPFVSVLVWAAVFALTFAPVHARILKRTRRPNLSALLATLFVVFVIGVPMGLVTWAIVREIVPAIGTVQGAFAEFLDPESRSTGPVMRWLSEHIDIPQARLQIINKLGSMSSEIASRSVAVVGNVVMMLVQALFVVFTKMRVSAPRSAPSYATRFRHEYGSVSTH